MTHPNIAAPMAATVFWIASDAAGRVRAGIDDPLDPVAWTVELTPDGWSRVAGTSDPPMPPEDVGEAVGELCWCLANAAIMGDGMRTKPGPWRLEMTYAALVVADT